MRGPFPTLTPELVGEWLKNDSIRALVVEAAAATVAASSRPATPKREFPTYGGKCSAMVSRKSVGRITGMVTSKSAANIFPPLGIEKKYDGNLAEKLVLTALRDKDLVSLCSPPDRGPGGGVCRGPPTGTDNGISAGALLLVIPHRYAPWRLNRCGPTSRRRMSCIKVPSPDPHVPLVRLTR